MKKFLIIIFTILIGLGLVNKLYNNNPIYEEGALEEYLTYLEENLPTYVPKLLNTSFNEGVFTYPFVQGLGRLQENKNIMELTNGVVIEGKIRDENGILSETVYEFYQIEDVHKWWQPSELAQGETYYVLKTEWENEELNYCTMFISGEANGGLETLVRNIARYLLAYTIMPIYIVHSVAVILWGIISL